MNKYIVTANKLNKRNSIPADMSDKRSIVGTVNKGVVFEADEVTLLPNPAIGKWYRDRDNYYYWGGGISLVATTSAPPATFGTNSAGAGISAAVLRQIFPQADSVRINELAAAFNQGFATFQLDSNLRRAHFFAQILEEVGTSASTRAENMNYAADRLSSLFQYFKDHPLEAQTFGRTAEHAANQEAIANRAYANRIGNGDVASGDGWKYRGKGYIQLTGKANYASIQRHIDALLPGSGINILNNEDDILTVKGAMFSAMAFFSKNNIHFISDAGTSDSVVDRVTSVVNRNTDSRAKRIAHFHEMKRVFQLT